MNKIKSFNLFFFVSLALWFNSPTFVYAASTDAQMSADVLVYINQYRASHHLPALKMNPIITKEAAQHSRDMANHAMPFGHDGFPTRIKHLQKQVKQGGAGAENVAYNYKTAKIVVDNWIKSPGHRQNIVGHYNQTGIGIARDRQGKIYYTQLFLRTDQQVTNRAMARRHGHRFPFRMLAFR